MHDRSEELIHHDTARAASRGFSANRSEELIQHDTGAASRGFSANSPGNEPDRW